jgi:hypothetical protein
MEAAQTTNNASADIKRNLLAGLRLATGRPLEPEAFVTTFEQGLWLLLTLVGLELLLGFVVTEQPAAFYAYGLNYLGAVYLFDLTLLVLIARLAKASPAQTGALLIANLAATLPYLAVTYLLFHYNAASEHGPLWAWTIWLLPIAWQLYILFRLLRLFLGIRIGHALSLAVFNIALSISSLWILPQSELWYTESPDPMSESFAKLYQLSVEDLFYEQRPLLEQTLQDLQGQRPGVTDLYLLAVGGYGLERVFLNEVEYVRDLFDKRYDTNGRSLLLVNNIETVDRYPLANRHNLQDALNAIGKQMDTNEDMLFLFMTSHGSSNHRFSVNFGPVPLDDLTPQQVRQALDDAGIRWRVIIVSSCYSGGFIEPLQDPHTLVITAAAPDRKSFGCGATSEFTDFGTAYFKHALKQQRDFIQAFDLAAAWVSDKEQREQRKASQPQRFVGEAMREKLALLDSEWQRQATRTTEQTGACNAASAEVACRL